MTTLLMFFFGVAILQAGIRMMVGHEMSVVPLFACALGVVLIMKAILRLLLWIAPKPPGELPERSSGHTPPHAGAPSES